MKATGRSWMLVALCGLFVAGAAAKGPTAKTEKKGLLDGRAFEVQLTEDGKAAIADRLSFVGGKLVSAELERNGFPPEPYEAKSGVDTIHFTAKMKSKKDGDAKWEGTLVFAADRIGGTLEWNKKGEKPAKYEFSGKEEKAAAPSEKPRR